MSDLKNFLMESCPKDETTAKNFVEIKALPIPEKNWKKPVGGLPPSLAIGGLNVLLPAMKMNEREEYTQHRRGQLLLRVRTIKGVVLSISEESQSLRCVDKTDLCIVFILY